MKLKRICIFALLVASVMMRSSHVFAADNIAESNQQLSLLEGQKQTILTAISILQTDIQEHGEKIVTLEAERQKLKQDNQKLTTELTEKTNSVAQRTENLIKTAKEIQQQDEGNTFIDTVLNAESLTDLFNRVSILNQLVSAKNKQLNLQKEAEEALKGTQQKLQEQQKAIEELKIETTEANQKIVSKKAELEATFTQVSSQYDLTLAEKQILEAQQLAAQQQAAESAARIVATEIVSNAGGSSAGFIRPSNGSISSEFGYRADPFTGQQKLHKGMDFAGSGAIVAAQSGRVVIAEFSPSWGYYVKIDHGNGLQTLYAHMQAGSLRVFAGQQLAQGTQLGVMGTTGDSTGVHLHFEVYLNGSVTNPTPYLGL